MGRTAREHVRDRARSLYTRLGIATREDVAVARAEAHNLYRQAADLAYLSSALAPRHPLPPARGWAANPDVLVALTTAVLRHEPTTVVELGSGTSSVVLGLAVRRTGSGRVHSIDHDPTFAGITRGHLADQDLSDVVTVQVCPLGPITDPALTFADGGPRTWYTGVDLPEEIDLVFVDGPMATVAPCARYPALPAVVERLAPGALVVVDDADRDDETQIVERWLERWPALTRETVEPTEQGLTLLRWEPASR